MGFLGFVREWVGLMGYTVLFVLLAYSLLSGLRLARANTFFRALDILVRPILDPIRRHLPRPLGWDLSPVVALILAWMGFVTVRYLLS
ncbi:MAG: hypothetical protein RL318_2801 [Fibrobacterota bacterium]|jgi:uncharacterized protein YggT (Ycf19 family)